MHDLGDRRDQRVGVARPKPCQHRQHRHVRQNLEDLGVLDLPRHDGMRHTGLVEHLEARPQMAERYPMDGRARVRGCVLEILPGLLAHGHDGDLMTHRTRRVQHEKREPPVARDQSKFHGRL